MSANHTPGPWTASEPIKSVIPNGFKIYVHVGTSTERGNALAVVYLGGDGAISARREDVKANAHLIAASPALLAACEAAANYMFDLSIALNLTSFPSEGTQAGNVFKQLCSAIAQAKGEAKCQ